LEYQKRECEYLRVDLADLRSFKAKNQPLVDELSSKLILMTDEIGLLKRHLGDYEKTDEGVQTEEVAIDIVSGEKTLD
jgi:hypothetical protein